LVAIPEMNRIGRRFLDLVSRETFGAFTVGKQGQEKHICSSEKMHIMVHCVTQAAALGDLINVEVMAEIIHRTAVRGPHHLDVIGVTSVFKLQYLSFFFYRLIA
jgi:hypothetical protein